MGTIATRLGEKKVGEGTLSSVKGSASTKESFKLTPGGKKGESGGEF